MANAKFWTVRYRGTSTKFDSVMAAVHYKIELMEKELADIADAKAAGRTYSVRCPVIESSTTRAWDSMI